MFRIKSLHKIFTILFCTFTFLGASVTDCDGDGIVNELDNCEGDFTGSGENPDQKDFDGDGLGDACDDDQDNDGISLTDQCPFSPNETFSGWISNLNEDNDGDGCRDIDEDTDRDNDGILNNVDNCPDTSNRDQRDTDGPDLNGDGIPDGDGLGDACDPDKDNDGIENDVDNCLTIKNPAQKNYDRDAFGDICDDDDDNDTIADNIDLCPKGKINWTSTSTNDNDSDGCFDTEEDDDDDNDTIPDTLDNCPVDYNNTQGDCNGNGIGSVCDSTDTIDKEGNCITVPDTTGPSECLYEPPTDCSNGTPVSVASCYLNQTIGDTDPDFDLDLCSDCSINQSACRKNALKKLRQSCGKATKAITLTNIPGCDADSKIVNTFLVSNPDMKLNLVKEYSRVNLPAKLPTCSNTEALYFQTPGGNSVGGCDIAPGNKLTVESYTKTLANICFSDGDLDNCTFSMQVRTDESKIFSLSHQGKNYTVKTGSSLLLTLDTSKYNLCYEINASKFSTENPGKTLTRSAFEVDTNNNKIPDMCEIIVNSKEISDRTGCTLSEACNYDPEAIFSKGCVFSQLRYRDSDADGFGDPADFQDSCSLPPGYKNNKDDNCPGVAGTNLKDFDKDGFGDICDSDDDGDGVADVDDAFPLNASENTDTDGDGTGDNADTDDDNDKVLDVDDSNPKNSKLCLDNDKDTCDDCSSGTYAPNNDGVDFDSDGLCDAGDTDDDNDGSLDANDSDDNNANVCSDTDTDSCDDCSSGTYDVADDGDDFDSDGLCDAGDPDDDNDGSLDADDINDNNANVCSDTDSDSCEDCTSGTYDVADDGDDFDSDGLCDAGDPDDDNDGSLDADDSDDNNANICSDTDGDTCDDCTSGTYDPANDGTDTDEDGFCDAGAQPDCNGVNDGPSVEGDCGACIEVKVGTPFLAKTITASNTIDDGLGNPTRAVAADIDNDDDYDIIAVDVADENIYYYLNDGAGNFGARSSTIVSSSNAFDAKSSFDTVDFDGDGNMDIVAMSVSGTGTFIWFQNDGSANFTQNDINITSSSGARAFTVVDIDKDGDKDVIGLALLYDKVNLHLNDGSQVLSSTNIHDTGNASNPIDVVAGDIDGDDDIDFLVSYEAEENVILFTNDGTDDITDNFTASEFMSVLQVKDMKLFDADGDGDLDFTAASTDETGGGDAVYFVRNNLDEISNDWAAPVTIGSGFGPWAVTLNDVDQDGFEDIVASGKVSMRWFKHNGNNSSPAFTEQGIIYDDDADTTLFMIQTESYDFDGDGDKDILTSLHKDDLLVWFENDYIECHGDCAEYSLYYKDEDGDGDGYRSELRWDCVEDGDPAPSGYSINDDDTDPTCHSSTPRDCLGSCGGDAESADDDCGICWQYETSSMETLSATIIEATHDGEGSVAFDADLDQDNDIISYDTADDYIYIHPNNGDGTFAAKEYQVNNVTDVAFMVAADVDNDGDLDVVVTSPTDGVFLLRNDTTFGPTTLNFAKVSLTSTGIDSAGALDVADIDDDGDVDIVVAETGDSNDKVFILYGNGDGTFEDPEAKGGENEANDPRSIKIVDLNGDGDKDILIAYESGDPSAAGFMLLDRSYGGGQWNFGPQTIDDTITDAWGVAYGDLDDDGDMDVVGVAKGDDISWYEADIDEMDNVIWTKNTINTADIDPIGAEVTDFDLDGDLDILVTSDKDILWFKNDGAANPTFTMVVLFNDAFTHEINTSTPVDMDGDGDLDILTTFVTNNDLNWFENDYAECLDGCDSIELFYLDEDGDGDGYFADFHRECKVGAGAPTGYSENSDDTDPECSDTRDCLGGCGGSDISCNDCDGVKDGSKVYTISSTETEITGATDNPKTIEAVDLDEDGDVDILSASFADNTTAWTENDGAGTPAFTFNEIGTSDNGARGTTSVDLDGDGDLDIVVSATSLNDLIWYENDGSESFTRSVIDATVNSVGYVDAADIDGDGDIDIVTDSQGNDKLFWYENDGSESFTQNTIIDGTVDKPTEIKIADMDNDGDLDIVLISEANNKLYWFENDGGADPSFTTREIMGVSVSTPQGLQVYDLENDGDLDIFVGSTGDDKVVVLVATIEEMGPDPINFQGHPLQEDPGPPPDPNPFDNPTGLHVTDLNGNGRADIIIPSKDNSSLYWYEYESFSMGQASYTKTTIKDDTTTPVLAESADLNGDGVIDIIGASETGDSINWYEGSCAEP